ncbi:MAG: SGNH/GDSL hydrolase family protein [Candidatus Omnitrophica bacterium]|nr:SGNH/GDSL hydrolase family protein [Candidatus Omnitrophota bacterium]
MSGKYIKNRSVITRFFLGLICAFIIGEICIRVLPHVRVSTVAWVPNSAMGALLKPCQRARFAGKEFNNIVFINTHGQHDYEHGYEKEKNVFRILILGDSMIEGLQVNKDNLVASVLSGQLNSKRNSANGSYEVIALARSGWGTAQQLKYFKEVGLKYKPDLVILCLYPANDFFNSCKQLTKDEFLPYYTIDKYGKLAAVPSGTDKGKGTFLYRVYKKSQLLCFLRQNISRLARRVKDVNKIPKYFGIFLVKKNMVWMKAVYVTLACLKELDSVCRGNAIQFLCVSLPMKPLAEMNTGLYYQRYRSMAEEDYDFCYPYTAINKFCDQNSILNVSMLESFQADFTNTKRSAYFQHEAHWNEYGHYLAASMLYEYLKNNSMLHF